MLVLDSGGVSRLARRDQQTAALVIALRRRGLWPGIVSTVVLAESLTGSAQRDANTSRFLACDLRPSVTERVARRAAELRTKAREGSAVDALVVAVAEPGGTVLTSDGGDLRALAANAADVTGRGHLTTSQTSEPGSTQQFHAGVVVNLRGDSGSDDGTGVDENHRSAPAEFLGQDLVETERAVGARMLGRTHRHPRQRLVSVGPMRSSTATQLVGSRRHLVVGKPIDEVVQVAAVNAHVSEGRRRHRLTVGAGCRVPSLVRNERLADSFRTRAKQAGP